MVLSALFNRPSRPRTATKCSAPRRGFRPRLEGLEDRTALSTLTVLNNSDQGPGSLRAVLAAASNGDQIVFDPALNGQTITLTSGELLLNKDLTITGPGAGLLTISGNHASRVFDVAGGTTVSLSGLTISNGRATNQGQGYSYGGGIYNAGTLTVSDSTLSGNEVTFVGAGGGIYNAGTLTVSNSALASNGIHLPHSVAAERGGGIDNMGTLTVSNSTFSGNQALFGAGISNGGTLTVSTSTFSGNEINATDYGFLGPPDLGGGGIYNGSTGTATVSTSTFSGNFGDFFPTKGGGIYNAGAMTLSISTVAGNTVGGGGGGIANAGTLTVTNSTLFGNTAGRGAGIFCANSSSVTSVGNSTISGNRATLSGPGAGGIGNGFGGTLNVRNTIVAGNSAVGGNLDLYGALASSGYNLIGNTQGGSGFAATDLLNVDPLLGPLQDNGGPTWTMALLPGSPALSAGDPAQLGVADQRGVVRRGGVNIGAYQASASAFVLSAPAAVSAGVPFDLTVTAVDAFGQVALGYTGTVTFSTSDAGAGVLLPPDYTLTAADQGSHTFGTGFTLVTAGNQALTATDLAGGLSASLALTVTP
jgi:hypothetical protein